MLRGILSFNQIVACGESGRRYLCSFAFLRAELQLVSQDDGLAEVAAIGISNVRGYASGNPFSYRSASRRVPSTFPSTNLILFVEGNIRSFHPSLSVAD